MKILSLNGNVTEEEIFKTRTVVEILVEATGGEITLESREGSGTRFMARIPPLY